ncbi:MAG TPA: hypothetical protein VGP93_00005, partial [Polyangiaceae bacterium]|nr:hypothetical protein [Polyangiaceae bacterium]
MTLEPPSGSDTGSAGDSGTLVFISDASAEAERLSAALRARGYALFDVPLGLLVNRVAVQRPALVICDADAPGALEAVRRVREVSGGQRIDVLFLGEAGRTLAEAQAELEREASGTFTRPVDAELLTRKVEALIGPPTTGRPSLLSGGSRSAVLVASTRRPYRFEGPTSFRPPASIPSPVPSVEPAANPPAAPTSSSASSQPPAPASIAPAPALTQARLSPELEMLLGRAEARVRQVNHSAPAPERLSPEAELDAILPADLLAALDEPLDVDDDEDDAEEMGSGTHGGSESESRSGRTGHGSVGGTGTGTPIGRVETAAGGSRPPADEAERAAPIARNDEPAIEEAPATPPALRTRNPPPMSFRTSLEPQDSAREVTAAPTGPPPRASDPPSLGTGADFGFEPPTSAVGHELTTRPPRIERELEPLPSAPPSMPQVALEVPAVLGHGDAIRALARAVRARFTGAIAFEDSSGI